MWNDNSMPYGLNILALDYNNHEIDIIKDVDFTSETEFEIEFKPNFAEPNLSVEIDEMFYLNQIKDKGVKIMEFIYDTDKNQWEHMIFYQDDVNWDQVGYISARNTKVDTKILPCESQVGESDRY